MTVNQLAKVIGVSTDRLMYQLCEAGLEFSNTDQLVSEEEKRQLLTFLQKSHGQSVSSPQTKERITLRRKSLKKIQLNKDVNSAKTVNVEVRRKRVYMKKPAAVLEEPVVEPTPVDTPEPEQLAPTVPTAESPLPVKDEPPAPTSQPSTVKPALKSASQLAQPKSKTKASSAKSNGPVAQEINADVISKIDSISGIMKPNRSPSADAAAVTIKPVLTKKTKKQVVAPLTQHTFAKPVAPIVQDINVPETITVAELAKKMSVKAAQVIKTLMHMGVMATINQVLDQDTAALVVEEMGHCAKIVPTDSVESLLNVEPVQTAAAVARAPIVTVMGHVDHGKTSLLDYIRRTKVAAGEAGGITQHIGAYHVDTNKGMVTFLDTPGHEAFTAMRARGSQVTDLVVLVVAGDDSVKPQTIEAIQHAKAAKVPIVVAVNKMDKIEADLDQVLQSLASHDVLPEAWGGEYPVMPISAKTGAGIDELLDAILLQAEMLELKAVVEAPARGVVLESKISKGRGPVATLLVQSGTLHKGDMLLAGGQYGRVRSMLNECAHPIHEAGPSSPVEVLGLSGVCQVGDDVQVVMDERQAREVALLRQATQRDIKLSKQKRTSLENLLADVSTGEQKRLRIVLKGDTQGSVEALVGALQRLSVEGTEVTVVASGVGGISETDVNLAIASDAMMLGFNVRADTTAKKLIDRERVDLRYYSVIYDMVEFVQHMLQGLVEPKFTEMIVGTAEVRDVFRSSKWGAIAGCIVIDGLVKRNLPIRVLRDNVVIFEGQLESLRRYKQDIAEVRQGTECGIGVKHYTDIKVGDKIEIFKKHLVPVGQ